MTVRTLFESFVTFNQNDDFLYVYIKLPKYYLIVFITLHKPNHIYIYIISRDKLIYFLCNFIP